VSSRGSCCCCLCCRGDDDDDDDSLKLAPARYGDPTPTERGPRCSDGTKSRKGSRRERRSKAGCRRGSAIVSRWIGVRSTTRTNDTSCDRETRVKERYRMFSHKEMYLPPNASTTTRYQYDVSLVSSTTPIYSRLGDDRWLSCLPPRRSGWCLVECIGDSIQVCCM
jgi:hypothetical protein